jgi:hypothetical protein
MEVDHPTNCFAGRIIAGRVLFYFLFFWRLIFLVTMGEAPLLVPKPE